MRHLRGGRDEEDYHGFPNNYHSLELVTSIIITVGDHVYPGILMETRSMKMAGMPEMPIDIDPKMLARIVPLEGLKQGPRPDLAFYRPNTEKGEVDPEISFRTESRSSPLIGIGVLL